MNNVGVKIYVTDLSVNELGNFVLDDRAAKVVKVGRLQTKQTPEIDRNFNSEKSL